MPVHFAVSDKACIAVNPGEVATLEDNPGGGTKLHLRNGRCVIVLEGRAQVIALITTHDAEVQREQERSKRRLTTEQKYEQL